MAQLFFKHGVINNGKATKILKVAHNYEEQDKPAVLMTSGLDTRGDVGKVSSRIGLRRDTIPIFGETGAFDLINGLSYEPFCVLVDECQFLNKYHVTEFARIVDELDTPVMAFGLENDFRNELFEDSKYLPLYVDKLEELKTICQFYHKRATVNLYYIDGSPACEGDRVQIDGNETYYPVYRKHYFRPKTTNEEQQGETLCTTNYDLLKIAMRSWANY